jgi:hypothetical protein
MSILQEVAEQIRDLKRRSDVSASPTLANLPDTEIINPQGNYILVYNDGVWKAVENAFIGLLDGGGADVSFAETIDGGSA